MTITSGTAIFLDFAISQNRASTTCERERVVGRGFLLCAPGEGGTGQVVLARSDVNKLIIIQTMDLIFIFLLNTKPDRNLALVASII